MHAYLLVTQSPDIKAAKEVFPAAKRIIEFSIKKISDTKDVVKFTSVSLAEQTVLFLPNFDLASTEAQNAFLKTLEESQEKLSYLLTAQNEALVLPTILSRCTVIYTANKKEVDEKGTDAAISFRDSKITERLEIVSMLAKREDAIDFLENLLQALYISLPQQSNDKKMLELANEALFKIKQNANPTLQMTNFLISL